MQVPYTFRETCLQGCVIFFQLDRVPPGPPVRDGPRRLLLLPGHLLPLGLPLPPAAQGHPAPQDAEEEDQEQQGQREGQADGGGGGGGRGGRGGRRHAAVVRLHDAEEPHGADHAAGGRARLRGHQRAALHSGEKFLRLMCVGKGIFRTYSIFMSP